MIGEDANGVPIFEDYKVPAEAQRPAAATRDVDDSLLAIVSNWRVVVVDLARIFHVDLYDPAVQARPWPGVRTMLFALLDMPTSDLRRVLTRR